MNSVFQSEIAIRPDDIDLNNHVHNTKYLDFVQAARFLQMANDYKVPMEEYHERGFNWFASSAHIDYKRALKLGDTAIVKTQLDSWNGAQCRVNFWIHNKKTDKVAAEGYFIYTMVSLSTGRPIRIPEDIIERHSI